MHRPLGCRAREEPGQAREAEPGRAGRSCVVVPAEESGSPPLVFGWGWTSSHVEPPRVEAPARIGGGFTTWFTTPRRFFSWTAAQDPLHGPPMQTDPVRALEAVHQGWNRQCRLVGALSMEKGDHRWRAGAGAHRTGTCIAQAGKPPVRQPVRQPVEGLTTVAERRADARHRPAVQEVCAQHLVLDLEFVAGVEESWVLQEQGGVHPIRRRMKRPNLRECLTLRGVAFWHGLPPVEQPHTERLHVSIDLHCIRFGSRPLVSSASQF